LARRGLDEEQCRLRLAAQWPQQKKAAKADLIIENIGTLKELEQKAVTVLEQIRNKENDRNG
jgi:dephospho-CoA kinase